MEEYELKRSDCEILSPLSRLENLLKSFNETYGKEDFKESTCHIRKNKKIETKSYFTDFANSTEYLSLKDIDTKKVTTMESRLSFTDLNCPEDMINVKKDVPLRVLIRRMLDEAFGKSTDTVDVDKNRCNVENNNFKVNLSNSLVKDESINSNSEINDRISFHESHDDCTRRKDDKLVTIAEERSNSLHHADIECTGLYLSGLFKFNDKLIDPVKDKNPLLLRNDTEVFPSQIDADVRIDESLCHTIVVQDESSIYEQNSDDKNESVMIVNMIDSSNDTGVSSNFERTVDFLNFSENKSNIKMKKVPNESLSSFDQDKTRSSTDTCLKDIDCSMKKKPKFISTFTLNLRRSCKRHRQSITLYRQALLKRTPKLSLKTNSKPAKTPGRSVTRSRNNSKQTKLLPQIILTPATPKPIPLL